MRKIEDPAMRQRAYKSYCDHLALGKSMRSWWFEEGKYKISFQTMENYLKDTQEFDIEAKRVALAKGFAVWEKICEDAATGKDNGRSNGSILSLVMRNKHGWDKPEVAEQPAAAIEASIALTKLLNHLTNQNSMQTIQAEVVQS